MPNTIAPTPRSTPRWPILLLAAVAVAAWGAKNALEEANAPSPPMSAVARASYPTSPIHSLP